MSRNLCGFAVEDGPILVTGASGFVGRTLMEMFDLGTEDFAADASTEFTAPGGVKKIHWELPGPPPDSLGEVRYVVHLAGLSSVAHSHRGQETVISVNGRGTASVAHWVKLRCPGARILLASSAEVYRPPGSPLRRVRPRNPGAPTGRASFWPRSSWGTPLTISLSAAPFPISARGSRAISCCPPSAEGSSRR